MHVSLIRFSCFPLILFAFSSTTSAQNRIDPATVTIARDAFGVPHIMAKTDAGAAYGLAYAQAEDAFETMQEPLFALRGQLSSVKGKAGALLDAVGFLVDAQTVANEKYDTDLSEKFKKIVTAYVQGVNDYAMAHPKQMLRKDLFPVTEKEIIAGYVMMMTFISGVQFDLLRIFSDKVDEALMRDIPSGSNGWAVSPERTDDGGTYLADVIAAMNVWNGSVDKDNRQAAIFSLAIQHLAKYIREEGIADLNNTLPKEEFVKALKFAKKHLKKHFGTTDIALGDLQKHVRGDKELPIWGVPEAITQMYTVPYKKGKYQSYLGESYILLVQYLPDGGIKLESIQPYGSSSDPESPHYDDFMEPFVNQELRPVTLDKTEILEHAEKTKGCELASKH